MPHQRPRSDLLLRVGRKILRSLATGAVYSSPILVIWWSHTTMGPVRTENAPPADSTDPDPERTDATPASAAERQLWAQLEPFLDW